MHRRYVQDHLRWRSCCVCEANKTLGISLVDCPRSGLDTTVRETGGGTTLLGWHLVPASMISFPCLRICLLELELDDRRVCLPLERSRLVQRLFHKIWLRLYPFSARRGLLDDQRPSETGTAVFRVASDLAGCRLDLPSVRHPVSRLPLCQGNSTLA